MEILIHLGYPKTGSSAIQAAVFANQGWLQSRGVYIPATCYGSGLGHAFVFGPALVEADSPTPEQLAGLEARLAALVGELDEAQRLGYDRALLTWEGFAFARGPLVARLATALSGHTIRLVAYVRDQCSLYQSGLLQSIKSLNYFNTAQFFEPDSFNLVALERRYNFFAGLSAWHEAFGGEVDCCVRLFDRARLENANVVDDFLAWMGLVSDDGFVRQSSDTNPSLDVPGSALLLLARQAGATDLALRKLANALLRVPPVAGASGRSFLAPAEVAVIRDHFADSNRRFFQAFRPDNARPGEEDFVWETPGEDPRSEPGFQYYKSIYSALKSQPAETWLGGLLTGRSVSQLTYGRAGWSGPTPGGVWMLGCESRLSFRLPGTHPESGPGAIKLKVAGEYSGAVQSTRVRSGGKTVELDLTDACLTLPVTRGASPEIEIVFEHMFPRDHDPAAVGQMRAFRMASIAYSLSW